MSLMTILVFFDVNYPDLAPRQLFNSLVFFFDNTGVFLSTLSNYPDVRPWLPSVRGL